MQVKSEFMRNKTQSCTVLIHTVATLYFCSYAHTQFYCAVWNYPHFWCTHFHFYLQIMPIIGSFCKTANLSCSVWLCCSDVACVFPELRNHSGWYKRPKQEKKAQVVLKSSFNWETTIMLSAWVSANLSDLTYWTLQH